LTVLSSVSTYGRRITLSDVLGTANFDLAKMLMYREAQEIKL